MYFHYEKKVIRLSLSEKKENLTLHPKPSLSKTRNEASQSAFSLKSVHLPAAMKRCENLKSKLPDCIVSYIFSKLSMKDLVKTSTLSKQWLHEWGFRTDLNFDLQNMFHYNTIQELPKNFPLLQSQFATILDQFMMHYQGAMIHSIRVNFPLGDQHRDVIDKLISKGIAKGAKRIELLFSNETNYTTDFIFEGEPYKFPFTLLSDTYSLTHLHLEKCLLVAPMDFSGFKNLRTLVLHIIDVSQDMFRGLFSNCIHLVDFTLDNCNFISDIQITSSTLFHLNIVNCGISIQERKKIDISAPNLSSFQYSSCIDCQVHPIKIEAHMLSKFSFTGGEIFRIFKPVGFSGLKNVTTIVLDGLLECLCEFIVPKLFSKCCQLEDVTFKNCRIMYDLTITSRKLRHLKIIDCGYKHLTPDEITVVALNLSSFEYSGYTRELHVKAPRLLKVFWNATKEERYPHHLFGAIPRSRHVQNLAMIMMPSQIANLTKVLVQFQNLQQLELLIEGACDPNMDYFWILDIIMASQHLRKLSLTIRNSHVDGSHRQRREHGKFFHNYLKYVELRGCVCTMDVIELASHLLRNVNSLKQITFSSCDKFYIGAERWTKTSKYCCYDGNLIHEVLKDEVDEQCQLIIL
uniref:Cyclin-like F-box n=1 Tax=Medicago truncatula TaxID=3880 RepID=Q2HWB9_MEDTR|nr:Cyclin-like F-box [Medicago truncatula]